MRHKSNRHPWRDALAQVEEATHLLRTAPLSVWATYYVGAAPFAAGLMWFWTDMSFNPFAPARLAGGSLMLVGLYIWMKYWQAVFALQLRSRAAGQPPPAWSLRSRASLLARQLVIQCTGLLVTTLAGLLMVPFVWVLGFYQNVTVLPFPPGTPMGEVVKKAYRLSASQSLQQHALAGILSAFALFVLGGLTVSGLFVPRLLKMLFGFESVFTRSPGSLLNTTFLMAVCVLTYLCVDPLLKSAYVLRCFVLESKSNGDDLKAELVRSSKFPGGWMVVVLFLLLTSTVCGVAAQNGTAMTPPQSAAATVPAIPTDEMNRVLEETIHDNKFAWRLPREKITTGEGGPITRFLDKVNQWLRSTVQKMLHWFHELLIKLMPKSKPRTGNDGGGYGWILSAELMLYGLLVGGLILLGLFIYRLWRERQSTVIHAKPLAPAVPDLHSEQVTADQLPEDGWTRLARELLAQGELRLALRAFYLASLAQLAARGLIILAAGKSNREYERELRRRGHALPDLPPVFSYNLNLFERAWYGLHDVRHEHVEEFAANVERMRRGA